MKGYVTNIENAAKENNNFRRVLYTANHCQLVLMSLKPGEDIGQEVHDTVDQFFRIEAGEGKAVIEGQEHKIGDGFAIVIPAGTKHNIVNTSKSQALSLYTIYSPPNHQDKVMHATKEEAEKDNEHFDGNTTE